jgi:Flp pilus assembly protein TadG
MSTVSWKQRPRTAGTAIVEAALVMPLLLVLVFGAMEYGWMFVVYGDVVNAARAGARLAVIPTAGANDVNSQIIATLKSAGLNVDGTGSGTTVTPSITVTPSDWPTAAGGTIVTVQVSIPYSMLTNYSLLPVPTTLQATVAMAKEGP